MTSTALLTHTQSFVDIFYDLFAWVWLNFVETALNFLRSVGGWAVVGINKLESSKKIQRIMSNAVRSHNLGGHLWCGVSRTVWYVAPSCWNHMFSSSISCHLGPKKANYHGAIASTINCNCTTSRIFKEK